LLVVGERDDGCRDSVVGVDAVRFEHHHSFGERAGNNFRGNVVETR
jgi:hypothetical protein